MALYYIKICIHCYTRFGDRPGMKLTVIPAKTEMIVSYSVVSKMGLGSLDNSDVELGKGFICNHF
jgi:hypothetical protein